jgi:hypothetical protein
MERSIARLNLGQPAIALAEKLGPGHIYQRGPYIVSLKKADSDKSEKAPEENEGMSRFNRYRYEGETVKWNDTILLPDTNEILTVSDALTGNTLWSRTFGKDVPHVYANYHAGVIAFAWEIGESGAKAEFDRSPLLAEKRSGAKDRDYLIEVVDFHSGSTVAGMVYNSNDGVVPLRNLLATRSWVAITDSYGRALIYNLKTGVCTGKVFGTAEWIAADSADLVIRYDARHFSLFDANTMTKLADYVFSDPLNELLLSPAGDKLFALSDTQTTYVAGTQAAPKQDSSLQAK